jgi:GDPmannose 4,6-dehydratase
MRTALITGAAGQDGILLAGMLAADGYRVVGLIKPGTSGDLLRAYVPAVEIVAVDLADAAGLASVIAGARPEEIYNLGGVSSITESVSFPEMTRRVNVGAVETILAAMRDLPASCTLVQAASGAVFEGTEVEPQSEDTPMAPRTPYAVAKADTVERIRAARGEGLRACSAILYNHESPLRGAGFVTRRISEGVARIAAGLQDRLELGNIDVCRDWGWAPDYVRGMRLMMAAAEPDDYVLATGVAHRLSEFLSVAFAAVGIPDWADYVVTRDDLRRDTDPTLLRGDSTRAERALGWAHTRSFAQIVEEMVAFDRRLLGDPTALWHEA